MSMTKGVYEYEFSLGSSYVGPSPKETFSIEVFGYTPEEWDKLWDTERENALYCEMRDWAIARFDCRWNPKPSTPPPPLASPPDQSPPSE